MRKVFRIFIFLSFILNAYSLTGQNSNKIKEVEPKEFTPLKNSFFIQGGLGLGASSFYDTYSYYSFNGKMGNRWLLNSSEITSNPLTKSGLFLQLTWLSWSENQQLRYSYDEVIRTNSILGIGVVGMINFNQVNAFELGLNLSPRIKTMRIDKERFFGLQGNLEARYSIKRLFFSLEGGFAVTNGLLGVSSGLAIGFLL